MRTGYTLLTVTAAMLFAMLLVASITSPACAQGAGRALDFDGNNDYVEITDDISSVTLPTKDITLEAWVYLRSFKEWGGFISAFQDNDTFEKGWVLGTLENVEGAGSREFSFAISTTGADDGNGNLTYLTAGTSYSTNTWYHVAGTYDGTTMKIYVNGELKNSSISPQSGNINYPSSAYFDIGIYHDDNEFFPTNGRIDEVRIWNVALDATTIRDWMCKKVTSDHPNWDDMVAYWKLDESTVGSGSAKDSKGSNDGTPTNMDGSDCVWSGAALGDASAYDYTGTDPGDFSANVAHGNGDDLTATGDGGTVTGIQVYRVDATSMRTDATKPSGWTMDPLRYWGVFVVGTSPTYTVIYDYGGHPGIPEEGDNDLELAYRDDHADDSWADLDATWDAGANTLTKTGQSGTEYALGSPTGDNSLPVTLTSFTAQAGDGKVTLHWVTESEIDNLGFHVYRALEEEGIYQRLTSEVIEGAGTATGRREYGFTDVRLTNGMTYWYKIEDVAFDGTRTMHGPISVMPQAEEAAEVQTLPTEFGLSQNFPNPFNPVTEIRYQLPEASVVVLAVYDVLGQEVQVLVEDFVEAGYRSVVWDGREAGSGVYFIRMEAGDFVEVRKMVVIR